MATPPRLILDIGTHKILGLAVQPTSEGVQLLASARRIHSSRAMRDGQVHDVPAVARTVRAVVDELEAKLADNRTSTGPSTDTSVVAGSASGEPGAPPDGTPRHFTEAYIAAAGRALQTARGNGTLAEPRPISFTADMQRALEWDAVADAQANLLATLPRDEQAKGFYCIAHSVTASRIDDDPIASLVDQRGARFSIDVLATFLPGVVVDSLQAVLRNAGLAMRGLTLEPVAALEAVVPPTMRHLRLMLVDVGAGTTDIAFTGGGVVQAYAMVPLGGDAVTEALAHALLLDFTVAEEAKQKAATGSAATVENVLGDRVVIDEATLWRAIEPAARRLAKAVADVTKAWDFDAAPDAVLLVGGGSNTPRLLSLLADELQLPVNRLSVRDRAAVHRVDGEAGLQGPDVVTALGIALRFARHDDVPPVRVRVNGRPVSLFQPDRCTVREAARIAGLPLNHLVGRLGHGITVTVNDELVIIPGRRGRTAAVQVNGAPASLDTIVHMNDEVDLQLPPEGDVAHITVAQLVERWRRQRKEQTGQDVPRVQWNGTWITLPLHVERQNHPVALQDTVHDRDVFEFRWPQTIGELHNAMAAASTGVEWTLSDAAAASASVPGGFAPADGASSGPGPTSGAEFALGPTAGANPAPDISLERPFAIVLNGEQTTVTLPAELRLNGAPAGPSDRIEDGDRIDITAKSSVALYELLSHPKIDGLRRGPVGAPAGAHADANAHFKAPPGSEPRRLVLRVRGEPAGFTTIVGAGDAVDIQYE